jgi:hypothetical protein
LLIGGVAKARRSNSSRRWSSEHCGRSVILSLYSLRQDQANMTASKTPRNKALKALSALNRDRATVESELPDLFPFGVIATRPRDSRDDRNVVLICGTVVEQGLEDAILTFFAPDGDQKKLDARDVLFDGEAPVLGDFAAKIKVAKIAGIIGPMASADLHLIRAIRNAFAHNRRMITFETPQVTAACEEIVCPLYWQAIMDGQIAEDAREKFIQTCFQLSLHLFTYGPTDPFEEEPDIPSEFIQRRKGYLRGQS